MKRAAMLLVAVLAVCTAHAQSSEEEEDDRLEQQESRDARQSGGFYSSPQQSRGPPKFTYRPDEDEGLSRNTVAPSAASLAPLLSGQSAYRPRQPPPQDSTAEQQQRPLAQVRRPPPGQQHQVLLQEGQLTEEELEEEKPDKLTLLLPQSKFDCSGKTGYYADDGLNCEVFHYCQDNARHSWICPDGFLFHQVHLICMPPSNDNICKQSSQYHFVNDYLYRPINTEEAQSRPNVTLRYSDRYYPDNYYEDKEDQPQAVLPSQPVPLPQRIPVQTVSQRGKPVQFQAVQRPVQVQLQPLPRAPQVQLQPVSRVPQLQQPTPRVPQLQQLHPSQLRSPQANQVFRSPEEVNIPLQHRRPPPTTAQPQRTYQPVSEDDEDYEYDDPPFRG